MSDNAALIRPTKTDHTPAALAQHMRVNHRGGNLRNDSRAAHDRDQGAVDRCLEVERKRSINSRLAA